MSYADCIKLAFKSGRISKDVADKLSAAQDPDIAIDEVLVDLTRQKRETAIQSVRMADAITKIDGHPVSAYDGLVSLLTKDQTGKAGFANVEYLGKFYQGKFLSQFADALSTFRTRTLGFTQDTERLNKLIRAIYGEAVDDLEVKQFAKQWSEITEDIRKTFNQKGGSVSKNEKWLMPQNHDARAVQKMGLEEWKKRIIPLLDRDQMLDDLGKPLDDEQFTQSLDFAYESITTHGLNKVKEMTIPRLGKKLSRKGADRRFLYFKNADSWIAYNREFGKGDIFTTLTDHIESRSNDIALMEIFGTSPDSTWKALKTHVEKQGMTNRQKAISEWTWNNVSGKTNQGELTGLADFMQSVRNVLTASTLGGAFISSISDIGAQAITSKYNSIPAFKTLSRHLSLMNPAKESDRIAAVKMGLMADAWLGRAQAANRYSDVFGTGATSKMAEAVMRASLLSPWTDAGRKAFGMEYSSMLADNFGKKLSELDSNLKRAFETYGINETDWNAFRRTATLNHKGAKFADLTKGVKFHQMIMSETDFAVPTPDAKVRAITTGGLGRSTIEGQTWRSAMMLKSFPVTIATTHFYRAANQATMGDKLGYAATFLATSTVLGGIALQAKDIAAGREPRPADNPKFFFAAWQQGGGLGIFGDFLFSDVNRFGGGITQTLTGPTGELLDTSVKMTLGNLREAVSGEETNILGESAQVLRRYTPDTWQTRLFIDALFDKMEMMANPDAEKRFNRMMRRRQKEYDQGYWWKKGELTPEILQ